MTWRMRRCFVSRLGMQQPDPAAQQPSAADTLSPGVIGYTLQQECLCKPQPLASACNRLLVLQQVYSTGVLKPLPPAVQAQLTVVTAMT
jgi:hypothetical protein